MHQQKEWDLFALATNLLRDISVLDIFNYTAWPFGNKTSAF